MTTSQPADDTSPTALATSLPRASPGPASDPVSRRLADLEERLARLEGESGPPASVGHRLSRRLDALEAREHHHAQAVAHFEGRLADLQSRQVQGLDPADSAAPSSTSPAQKAVTAFPPRPKRSLARRALDGLHYLRYVWRRLQGHEEGAFPDQSLREIVGNDVQNVPSLGLVVLCREVMEIEVIQESVRQQTAVHLPYVTFMTQSGRLGPASDGFWSKPPPDNATDALRGATADFLITVPVEELDRWPSTLAECVQLCLAVEELDVLEVLLAPTLRALVQRPQSWHPLAHRSIQAGRGQVGKIIDLANAPMAALLDSHFERRFGPYRFANAGSSLTRHRLTPSAAAGTDEDGATVVLSEDLLAGREQLFSDLFLRLGSTPWLLVGEDDPLTRQRLVQLQRVRRLDGVGSRIYPLGSMLPAPLRSGAVDWVARRWGATSVLPLVAPSEVEAHREEEPLSHAIASSLKESLALHYPPHQDGALLCHSTAAAGSSSEVAIESLRRQLDWPEARPVVLWFGDLLAEKRPEDFLALARTCRGDASFLMIGRGPLEGSIDDLAGFLDLHHFRRLPSLPLSFAISLSRVVCSTASHESLPYSLLAAVESGRGILLPEGSGLSRRLVEHGVGLTYALGDTDSARQSLIQLLTEAPEASKEGDSKPEGAGGASLDEVDAAWRACLAL